MKINFKDISKLMISMLILNLLITNIFAEEIELNEEQINLINNSVGTSEKIDIIYGENNGKVWKDLYFLNFKEGTYDYIKNLKKFQAMNNLTISGVSDNETKRYIEENRNAVDIIDPKKVPWEKLITINKDKNIMTIYDKRLPIDKFPISTGTNNRTPSMKTSVMTKFINPAWGGMRGKYRPVAGGSKDNPLGKRWMGLDNKGLIGIHGTLEENWIGKYRTQGCIRMFNSDIENIVFPQLSIGTPVWIGNTKELESWGIKQLNDL